jgi:hypothetical protein
VPAVHRRADPAGGRGGRRRGGSAALGASVTSTYARKPSSPALSGSTHRLHRWPHAGARLGRAQFTTLARF